MMLERLNVYCLSISKEGNVFVVAGSVTEAVKLYLKSINSVDESVILSVQRQISNVFV